MKPNFKHQNNHAGKSFTGCVVAMCYYWVNRRNNEADRDWCIKRIRRKKSRNKRRYKLKYDKRRMENGIQ